MYQRHAQSWRPSATILSSNGRAHLADTRKSSWRYKERQRRSSLGRLACTGCSACPRLESQGRVQTSTATGGTEVDEVEVKIDDKDIEISCHSSAARAART